MPPGHIGITVDDTYKACKRFESLDVPFVKKPDDGSFSSRLYIQLQMLCCFANELNSCHWLSTIITKLFIWEQIGKLAD